MLFSNCESLPHGGCEYTVPCYKSDLPLCYIYYNSLVYKLPCTQGENYHHVEITKIVAAEYIKIDLFLVKGETW